jgi:DNA-binding FrmR family transcriptional regulator
MVETEQYCVDTLRQTAAVREALSSMENLLLENHLTTCVIGQVRRGEAAKVAREVLTVYRLAKQR